ncbi:MAG TPA: PspC domain-containing protein [Pedobacter sp.]|jgi:phage shock protein PspC (stress-responsive transcriptional regulator)
MNKTIIININGIVFHIEEDAYEVLKSYMTEVKRHFAYSKDSVEIVTDIENRLAEMFSQRLAEQNKQVIILQDVEEITSQMGRAQDFENDEEDEVFSEDRLKSSKTLYRDGDDKMIAGVCAGLAHYFDIETKWMRLVVIVTTLISGIGLIPYIVLWALVPIAKTRQEKMAMKGEAINLQNFKRSFDETAETGKGFNQTEQRLNTSDPVKEIIDFIVKLIKLFLKIIGIIIISVGAAALFAAIFGLIFGLGFLNNSSYVDFPFNAINDEYRSPIFFSAFLLLCIPLIALILFAIRVLLNRKVISRYGSFAMLILWLTGLGMGVYYGSKVASEFREEAKLEQTSALKSYPSILIKMDHKFSLNSSDSVKYNVGRGKFTGRVLYGDNRMNHNIQEIELFIEKSDDTSLSVMKELSGRGQNFEQALQAAQRINYQVTQKDSVIQLAKYFSLQGNGLYRDQELDVRLKIPVNTKVLIEGNLGWRLRDINLWDCQEDNHGDNEITEWIMTEEGLKCTSKKPSEDKGSE